MTTSTSSTYNRETVDVTLAVRKQFPIATFGSETVYAPFADMPVDVLRTLIEQGAMRILKDGAGGKDKSDADKIAGMRKRIDAWLGGNFHVTERAAGIWTTMREAYVAEQQAKHEGLSSRAVEQAIDKTIKSVLGADAKLTFENFLRAVAKSLAKKAGEKRSMDDLFTALVEKYEKAAGELIKAHNAALAAVKIDLTDIEV